MNQHTTVQVYAGFSVPKRAEVKKECFDRNPDSELGGRKAGEDIAPKEEQRAQHRRLEQKANGGGFKSLVEEMSQLRPGQISPSMRLRRHFLTYKAQSYGEKRDVPVSDDGQRL